MVLKNSNNLKSHILRHEDPEAYKAKVQCNECGKWIRNGSGMRNHLRVHRDEMEDYICPHCNKKIASSSSLKRHINYVHVMKRTHQCRFCEKAFKQPFELTVRILKI